MTKAVSTMCEKLRMLTEEIGSAHYKTGVISCHWTTERFFTHAPMAPTSDFEDIPALMAEIR